MHVYIIDDDEISTFLAEQVLLEEGVASAVSSFPSAADAFAALAMDVQEYLPDLMLLDLNMPEMSGWEFLDALKIYEQLLYGRCRIYILSSSLDQEDEVRAGQYMLVSGMLQKPIEPESLQLICSQLKNDTRF